jgi:hypothetical protein
MKTFWKFLDDILLITGCICILIGLSKWSEIITWIAAGMMLICLGVLVGRKLSKHVNP